MCPETYETVPLDREAELLRMETGNSALYARGSPQLPEALY